MNLKSARSFHDKHVGDVLERIGGLPPERAMKAPAQKLACFATNCSLVYILPSGSPTWAKRRVLFPPDSVTQ